MQQRPTSERGPMVGAVGLHAQHGVGGKPEQPRARGVGASEARRFHLGEPRGEGGGGHGRPGSTVASAARASSSVANVPSIASAVPSGSVRARAAVMP